MVARGEAAYDDHTSLNDLQADHFDSSAVKAPNVRPRDRSRIRSSNSQAGSSKSLGKHCYKWNEDSINCGGCNYTHACLVGDSNITGGIYAKYHYKSCYFLGNPCHGNLFQLQRRRFRKCEEPSDLGTIKCANKRNEDYW